MAKTRKKKYSKKKYNIRKNYKKHEKNKRKKYKRTKRIKGGAIIQTNAKQVDTTAPVEESGDGILTITHGGRKDILPSQTSEPEIQMQDMPLEDPKEIKAYISEKLKSQYSGLSEPEINNILLAAKTYSVNYDGLLRNLILKYIDGGDLNVFNETLIQWVQKYFIEGDFTDHELEDHVFGKYTEACKAININLEEKHPIETISQMYKTMKQRCIMLDKELMVYRIINLNKGDELIEEFDDITSTTYDPSLVFNYVGRNAALDDIIIQKIEEGQKTLDFTGELTSSIILKIKLPGGLNVFHTDICGPGGEGEKELVILDQCKLNILSRNELDGESGLFSDTIDTWIEDFKFIYEDDYDFSNLKVDKKTLKVKIFECTLSINEEQIDYDEVIMKPLLEALSSRGK